MANDPPRHRADDDLEALTTGSFRTPNGPTDLLDDSASAPSIVAAAASLTDSVAANNNNNNTAAYTIDGEGDDEEEDLEVPKLGPQDPSGEGEREPSKGQGAGGVGADGKKGKWAAKETKLAARTSKIMSAYQDYLAEIEAEFPGDAAVSGGAASNGERESLAERNIEEVRDSYREVYDRSGSAGSGISAANKAAVVGIAGGGGVGVGGEMQRTWRYKDDPANGPIREQDDEDDDFEVGIQRVGLFPDSSSSSSKRGSGKFTSHPAFRNKKVRQGIGITVLAIAIIGIIVGISTKEANSKKANHLPDWEAELEEQLEEGNSSNTERPPSNPDEEFQQMDEKEEHELVYKAVSQTYQPLWYDRSKGWNGQSYLQAIEFCAAAKEGYLPCPYEAICPLGRGSIPLGGFKEEDKKKGSWVPVGDIPNGWAKVSVAGKGPSCIRYSDLDDDPAEPRWGMTGQGNEDITRHVVCCLASSFLDEDAGDTSTPDATPDTTTTTDTAPTEITFEVMDPDTTPDTTTTTTDTAPTKIRPEDMDPIPFYQAAAIKYEPLWYDRKKGWEGQTYIAAAEFCMAQMGGTYLPCPYNAMCPDGPNTAPLGGYQNEGIEGSWAPIFSIPNEWVKVSEGEDSCVPYTITYPEEETGPEWGNSGVGNEEITRHVMCCKAEAVAEDEVSAKSGTAEVAAETTTSTTTTEATTTSTTTTTTTEATTTEPATTTTTTTTSTTKAVTDEEKQAMAELYQSIVQAYEPLWFNRNDGWEGTAYLEAFAFCSKQNSRMPCPYTAYCPSGAGTAPLGGVKEDEGGAWAPIMNSANSWVQLGKENTCELYSDIEGQPPAWGLSGEGSEAFTRNIACCLDLEEGGEEAATTPDESIYVTPEEFTEAEQLILDGLHPLWFGRDHGYLGTTHDEAVEFCGNIAHMDLCPIEAYCPNGEAKGGGPPPLFLQLDAFEGEQWAPFYAAGQSNLYVLVGTMYGNPTTTCNSYSTLKGSPPQWGLDGTHTELKEHVLCCVDSSFTSTGVGTVSLGEAPSPEATVESPPTGDDGEILDLEEAIQKELKPVWLGREQGWTGESHDDAIDFCESLGGKELCPYAAYCPHGPGQPVIGGHTTDFNTEGEQWAPVYSTENRWVLISQKKGNSATTCLGHNELEGSNPEWGLSEDKAWKKKHILCCENMQ